MFWYETIVMSNILDYNHVHTKKKNFKIVCFGMKL